MNLGRDKDVALAKARHCARLNGEVVWVFREVGVWWLNLRQPFGFDGREACVRVAPSGKVVPCNFVYLFVGRKS